ARAFVEQAGAGPADFGDHVGESSELGGRVRTPVPWILRQLRGAAPFEAQWGQSVDFRFLLCHSSNPLSPVPLLRSKLRSPTRCRAVWLARYAARCLMAWNSASRRARRI